MEGCCPDRRSRTKFAGPQNPQLAWQHDLTLGWAHNFAPSTKTRGAPAIGEDGTLYFGAEAGVFAVTIDGDQVWAFNAGGNKSSALIGPDRTVYVYSTNGTLYASPPTANPAGRWTPPLGGRPTS
jgi:outer membrane protein assembly factor BamB